MPRFRWVVCQLDALEKARSRKALRQALSSLPTTIDQTYERILGTIAGEDRFLAQTTFRLLAGSVRLLRLEEVAEALAIDLDSETPHFSPESRLQDPRDVLAIASALITSIENLDGTENIVFAHFSVKEFLASERIQSSPVAFGHISNDSGQFILELCLTYLRNFEVAGSISAETLSEFPLAEYAAKFWTQHAASVEKSARKTDRGRIKYLMLNLLRRPTAFENWIRLFDLNDPAKKSPYTKDLKGIPEPLYYMSLAGLFNPVQWLLAEDEPADVNKLGGRFGTALQAAAGGGHVKVVTVLLESGADVNLQGGDYGNPLQAAATGGHVLVIEALLQAGADINSQGGLYGDPLQAAAAMGHEDVIYFLLRNGVAVDAQGGHYGNALQAAVAKGNKRVVELLIQSGVDINLRGGFYESSLLAATVEGQSDIVQVLLRNGADFSIERFHKRTLVHEASGLGHVEVMRHLLSDTDLEVAAVDSSERTALHYAAAKGHASMLQFLIQHGAEVDVRDKDGMTVLHCAADGGHPTAVKVLLEAGAEINAVDRQRSTALHLAIQRRHGSVHRLLIDLGARLDMVNEKKKTPTQTAFKMKLHPKRFCTDKRRSEKLTKGHQALSVEVLKRKPGTDVQKVSTGFRADMTEKVSNLAIGKTSLSTQEEFFIGAKQWARKSTESTFEGV